MGGYRGGKPPGPRVLPPRPNSPKTSTVPKFDEQASDFVVIDWRWDMESNGVLPRYTFGILTRTGRYEPTQVNNGNVTKKISEPFFRVVGMDEESCKQNVREFLYKVAGDRNVTIQFRPVSVGVRAADVRARAEQLHDELADFRKEFNNTSDKAGAFESEPEPVRKSLWAEWKEKRAARKADKKPDSGSQELPSPEED